MKLNEGEVDPAAVEELTDGARGLGFELVRYGDGTSQGMRLHGNGVHFGGNLRECAAFLVGWRGLRARMLGVLRGAEERELPGAHVTRDVLSPSTRESRGVVPGAGGAAQGTVGALPVVRALPRDQRQGMIMAWAETAFGREEATGLPQRGLRLLEEAIEAFQACGGGEEIAHALVAFVFDRPPGMIGQELGGVAVSVLALAAAAGLSADEEECREVHRVLSRPVGAFTRRNAEKNAAGFKISEGVAAPPPPRLGNPCCGNVGSHGEGGREYCSTCGADLGARTWGTGRKP